MHASRFVQFHLVYAANTRAAVRALLPGRASFGGRWYQLVKMFLHELLDIGHAIFVDTDMIFVSLSW